MSKIAEVEQMIKRPIQVNGEIVIFGKEITYAIMDTQSLKLDLIHWLTKLKDRATLEKIQAIKAEHLGLSATQEMELNERLEKYEKGEMKFNSWEATKANIRKRSKDAI